ncbi:hypothetical protein, partial [Staphylococcus aureus]
GSPALRPSTVFPVYLQFFQAEDGIRDRSVSRGLGDVYKRQLVSLTKTIVLNICLLYTSPSPRDTERSRMPSSA